MLIVLGLVTIAVAVWARWLVRDGRAPRWAKAIAPVVVVSSMVFGAGSLWGLHHAFDAVAEMPPSEKAKALADGISRAFLALAIGWGVVVLAIVVLAILTLRRRAP